MKRKERKRGEIKEKARYKKFIWGATKRKEVWKNIEQEQVLFGCQWYNGFPEDDVKSFHEMYKKLDQNLSSRLSKFSEKNVFLLFFWVQ